MDGRARIGPRRRVRHVVRLAQLGQELAFRELVNTRYTALVDALRAVDLGIETFLEPFSETLRFSIEYQPYEDAPLNRPCDVTGLDLGNLVLGATVVPLLDETGAEVSSIMLADADMDDDATFPLEAACKDFDRVRNTSEIPWSATPGQRAYSLKIETWAAGDDPMVAAPCFSNSAEPMPLAPGISPAIVVPRTRTDGACADCAGAQDCSRCEDRVCKL